MGDSVAIVGASLAGVNVAYGLRRNGYDGEIHLIGDEPGLPYDRPPLSKEYLLGTKSASDIALHPETFYAENDIDLWTETRVTRLRPSEGGLELDSTNRILRVDDVVLATGSVPLLLPMVGSNLPGVFYLRTLADAEGVRSALEAAESVVVVGGGFVGAEIAASAVALGKRAAIVEREADILSRVLPPELCRLISNIHVDKGVQVLTGRTVTAIVGDDRVRQVELSDGSRIEAQLVVVGIGVRPATDLAEEIGIVCDNGIVVDEYCRTSLMNVYAAGDVTNFPDPVLSRRIRLEHWQHAQNQGLAAAMAISGEERPYRDVPWFWSHQHGYDIQLAGHTEGADETVTRGDLESGKFCILYLRSGSVIGAFGVNAGRDVRGSMELIRTAVPVSPADLVDPGTNLRKLADHAAARVSAARESTPGSLLAP